MKGDSLHESGLSQRRFGTLLLLFKLSGIPLDSHPVTIVQRVYTVTTVVSYYITCVSCVMDLYLNRNDLEEFTKSIRLCISMTLLTVMDIFFRYEYMKLKTTLFNYIGTNFKNVVSDFRFLPFIMTIIVNSNITSCSPIVHRFLRRNTQPPIFDRSSPIRNKKTTGR
jgi:uncharacterized membrane protein